MYEFGSTAEVFVIFCLEHTMVLFCTGIWYYHHANFFRPCLHVVPVFSRTMDVTLLLDGATDTTQASFDASKTLVKKVAGSLDIPNAARLSVYQFGSTVWQELGYGFFRNYREVQCCF